MKYVNVVLPLPLEDNFTYSLPPALENNVIPGCRVLINFGKRKFYTAIVIRVFESDQPLTFTAKEVFALLDTSPVVTDRQLQFWRWISDYYICKLGDVYKAAVPSGLKLESETMVLRKADFETEETLRPSELTLLDSFSNDSLLSISELQKRTRLRNVFAAVISLINRGAVEITENIKERFIPKTETFVRLTESFHDDVSLNQLIDELKRAPKQEAVLLKFLELSEAPDFTREVSKKELLQVTGCTPAVINGLLKRGVIECYQKEIGRIHSEGIHLQEANALTEVQEKALDEIQKQFREKNVCLLHGVASSGKTEIYIHLIQDAFAKGKQVLYLLPEIAITTQITERLEKLFNGKMFVYHSKMTDNERVEIWNKMLHTSDSLLILGVRSSIFLPFHNLGLVVVDEEQETSFKQQDPAPRYHARDAAIVLASMFSAKTLLGSATPSIESYYNAISGKYGFVELSERFGICHSPEITVVDIKELRRKKIMKDTLFSPQLVDSMREALDHGEKVILFQNRRGFAPMIECADCGWIPRCDNCDVSLTYHKFSDRLVCHYCGHVEQMPKVCPSCSGTNLRTMGFGTEKVEEEIHALFPDVTVGRLDVDAAHTRTAYERIIADFDKGKTQILIGTQMLSKGLDFNNVHVVGILNADNMMNFPDFRANERAFQLMVQVSGRAGRRDKQGVVILQTSDPEHPLIDKIQRFAYKEMVASQLEERRLFHYPPYYHLMMVVLKSHEMNPLRDKARIYADCLRTKLGDRVFGPIAPVVSRVQSLYILHVILKLEASLSYKVVRKVLDDTYSQLSQSSAINGIQIYYDVDPY